MLGRCSADCFVPGFGLLFNLRVYADLRICECEEVPALRTVGGGEGVLVSPAGLLAADAVGVLRAWLEPGHKRLVGAAFGLDLLLVVWGIALPVLEVLRTEAGTLPGDVRLRFVGADTERESVDRVGRCLCGRHADSGCGQRRDDGDGDRTATQLADTGAVRHAREGHSLSLKLNVLNRWLQGKCPIPE